MRTVLEPRAHFAQPVAIAGIQAELLLNGRVYKIRVTSLSFAASLIMLETSCDQSEGTTFLPLRDQIQRLRFQQLCGAPARFRQLQEDIDIQSGLVAGVSTVEAPPAGIPISPMSMVPSPRLCTWLPRR
jgi:hypothetical protein